MGLLDSNIVRLNAKVANIAGSAVSDNSYLNAPNHAIDVSMYQTVCFQIKTITSGVEMLCKGGVTSSFVPLPASYLTTSKGVSPIKTATTYFVDVSAVKTFAFYIQKGVENGTVDIDYILTPYTVNDIRLSKAVNLTNVFDFYKGAEIRETSVSLNSVTTIIESSIGNDTLLFSYLYVSIKLADTSKVCNIEAYTDNTYNGNKSATIYDTEGNILPNITKSGVYYIATHAGTRLFLKNVTAIETTANICFFRMSEKPSAIDLKPIQTIFSKEETIGSGNNQRVFTVNNSIVKYFKFLSVYVRYMDSNGDDKNQTILNVSTSNTLNGKDCPYVLQEEATNAYTVTTDWINNIASAFKVKVGFTLSAANDKIYIEVRGIR